MISFLNRLVVLRQLTCIIVTHDTTQAARIATRVMLRERGCTKIGTLAELLEQCLQQSASRDFYVCVHAIPPSTDRPLCFTVPRRASPSVACRVSSVRLELLVTVDCNFVADMAISGYAEAARLGTAVKCGAYSELSRRGVGFEVMLTSLR
jgi:energy-coupling factor transporter ATP-binding protein EcfA2